MCISDTVFWLNPLKFICQFLAGMNTFLKKEGVCCPDADTHQNHTWNSCSPTPIHTVDHVSVPCLSRNVVKTFHVVIWIDPTGAALKSKSSIRHWDVSPASWAGISSDGKKNEFSPQNKPSSQDLHVQTLWKLKINNTTASYVLSVLLSVAFLSPYNDTPKRLISPTQGPEDRLPCGDCSLHPSGSPTSIGFHHF